jgi:hypothetical protein
VSVSFAVKQTALAPALHMAQHGMYRRGQPPTCHCWPSVSATRWAGPLWLHPRLGQWPSRMQHILGSIAAACVGYPALESGPGSAGHDVHGLPAVSHGAGCSKPCNQALVRGVMIACQKYSDCSLKMLTRSTSVAGPKTLFTGLG